MDSAKQRDIFLKWIDFILAALTVTTISILLMYLWMTDVPEVAVVAADPFWLTLCSLLFVVSLSTNLHARLPEVKKRPTPPLSLWASAAVAVVLMLIFTPGICGILWIMLVGQLPRYYSLKVSLLAAVMPPLVIGLYHQLVLEWPYALINMGLYTLFNLFVVYLSTTLESEQQAREQASRLVTELTLTQQLLASTSKRDERLRIARELHDLSGHHLAALSLQLEIARHTEGEQHDVALERAGVIAHLLLSELRDTVSTFRQHRGIDLHSALQTLVSSLARPKVWLQIESDLTVDDVQQAETLLRCVQEALTNSVRHSRAERAAVKLWRRGEQVHLHIVDNGGCDSMPQAGNGLTGMQERVSAVGGNLSYQPGTLGLQLDIELPLGNGLVV